MPAELLDSATFSNVQFPHGRLGLPSPILGLSSPAAAYSFSTMQQKLMRPRRREASEWRRPRSQNTTGSQNAARKTLPFPFLSGGCGLASASSSLCRLGNVDSGTIVPAPEERVDARVRGSRETPTLEPEKGQECSHFQAPHTKGKLDGKAGIWDLGLRTGGGRKWCRGPGPPLTI